MPERDTPLPGRVRGQASPGNPEPERRKPRIHRAVCLSGRRGQICLHVRDEKREKPGQFWRGSLLFRSFVGFLPRLCQVSG